MRCLTASFLTHRLTHSYENVCYCYFIWVKTAVMRMINRETRPQHVRGNAAFLIIKKSTIQHIIFHIVW